MNLLSLNTYYCNKCNNDNPANLEIYAGHTLCNNCRRDALGRPRIPSNIFYPEMIKAHDTIPAPAPQETYGDGDSSATVNDDYEYGYGSTFIGAFGDYDGA